MRRYITGGTAEDRKLFTCQELEVAGVEVVERAPKDGRALRDPETGIAATGRLTLGGEEVFTFERAWYYWIVRGNVPLKVARPLFEDHGDIGRHQVRVGGFAGGGVHPDSWFELVDDVPCVTQYHIDTPEGLRLFVETMGEHGLAD